MGEKNQVRKKGREDFNKDKSCRVNRIEGRDYGSMHKVVSG